MRGRGCGRISAAPDNSPELHGAAGHSSDTLGIALVGCGTVGGGVADILLRHRERLAARAGRPLALRRVVVRDPNKSRDITLPAELVTTDITAAIHDPAVHVVVELIGGTTT